MNHHIVDAKENERASLTLRSQDSKEAMCLASLVPRAGQTLQVELEKIDSGAVKLKFQVVGEVKAQASDKTMKISTMTRAQLERLAAEKGVDGYEESTDSELAHLLGNKIEQEAAIVRNG